MPGAHCVILNCTNGTNGLKKWRKLDCDIHGGKKDVGHCVCAAPFVLHTFPTELADPVRRKEWIKLVSFVNTYTNHMVYSCNK